MKIFAKASIALLAFSFVLGMPALTFAATAVNLGTAGNYTILTKSGVTTTGTTHVTGDIGVSPISSTAITGFGLIHAVTSPFSTSAQVSGKVYAPDYAIPTPAKLTVAVLNMQAAYTDAAGRAPTSAATTNVGGGTLTNLTLTAGVYQWGSAVTIPTNLTLSGSATDVWIFKVAGTLNIAANKSIILTGGALPQNIFWQVSGAVTLGAGSQFKGVILAKTNIAMITGATLVGRALAQTAVTLQSNAISAPSSASVPPPIPTPPPTPTPTPTSTPPMTDHSKDLKRDLEMGSQGPDVTVCQQRLIYSGYAISAGATGYFGAQTRTAVVSYQKAHGIAANGIVGIATRAALNK
jgi:Ice-binding-like/Putative peptidoglycan binding domain